MPTTLRGPNRRFPCIATLLLAFAAGASVGPIFASLTMERLGPSGLFTTAAAANFILSVFVLYRMTQRAPVPEDEQGDFVAMPQTSQTTQVVATLDPRNDDAQVDFD